jgi:hypothetical protein
VCVSHTGSEPGSREGGKGAVFGGRKRGKVIIILNRRASHVARKFTQQNTNYYNARTTHSPSHPYSICVIWIGPMTNLWTTSPVRQLSPTTRPVQKGHRKDKYIYIFFIDKIK